MCQPPVYSSGDYDNKFAVPRFDDMSTDSNSPNGPPSSSNDMASPFASSPSIMSPGMELPHGLQTDFTSMPEMVMSPISHAPPSSLSTPGGMNHQPQHSQHTPLSPFPTSNPQMHGLNASNINPPSNISLASQMHLNHQGLGGGINAGLSQAASNNNLMAKAPPQRTNSTFGGMALPQIRTVGDFHALQRANTDMNPMAMSPLGPDLDFNTLR
jgi:hypothetical protein